MVTERPNAFARVAVCAPVDITLEKKRLRVAPGRTPTYNKRDLR